MKIISFNTYLAPTMPDRNYRRPLLLQKITEWDKSGVDIVCLQEQNSHKIGCISKVLYKYFNNRFIDLFSAIEGYITPLFVYDNVQFIKDYVNETDSGYKYIYNTPDPTYGFTNGLIILSKIEFTINYNVNLPSDFVHVPGMLSISNDEYQIINCHLIPSLSNINYSYSAVNYVNKILCKNIYKIQRKNIDIISNKIDRSKKVILLGDFNIDKERSDNYEYVISKTGLIDSSDNEICITTHKNCEVLKQIDYILVSENLSNDLEWNVISGCEELSDHHPVMIEY
jgi:exonuclease III